MRDDEETRQDRTRMNGWKLRLDPLCSVLCSATFTSVMDTLHTQNDCMHACLIMLVKLETNLQIISVHILLRKK